MELKNYSSFFHDGGIINIEQNDTNIKISMESSQILPEWNKDNIPLSNFKTIKGKLYLEGIKKILLNHKLVNKIKMMHDSGEILNFDIFENQTVKLLIIWSNYPPKKLLDQTELIEIEAEKVYWENIPNLFNSMDFSEKIR